MSDNKRELLANITPFGLRMQADLKEALKRAAEKNNRSMNAEIVARLEDTFQEPIVLPARLLARIARDAKSKTIPVRNQIINTLEEAYPDGIKLGDFIERWVIPASTTNSREERNELIKDANTDADAMIMGFSIEEEIVLNSYSILRIYHTDYLTDDPVKIEIAKILATIVE